MATSVDEVAIVVLRGQGCYLESWQDYCFGMNGVAIEGGFHDHWGRIV